MFIKSFDRTKIWYTFLKQKNPVLVFVHGWANNWTTWKKEIDFFKNKGYSILTLDLRGHGKSDKPKKREKYKLECFAKDIHEIIKKEKINSFVLLGHSMGGMISLKYYELYKKERKIKSLILCATTYKRIIQTPKIIFPFIKHVLDFMISNNKWDLLHNFNHTDLSQLYKKSDYRVFYEGLQGTSMICALSCLEEMLEFDLTTSLKKINIPVLIMHGEHDGLLSKSNSVNLSKKIKNSQINLICAGKHFVNIQKAREIDKTSFDFFKTYKIYNQK